MNDSLTSNAYKVLLGRDPGADGPKSEQYPSEWAFRNALLGSEAFQSQLKLWELAAILYRNDATFMAQTTELAAFLQADPETTARILELVREPQDDYTKFHALRFADHVKAVLAIRRKKLPDVQPFRMLEVGISSVVGIYNKIMPNIEVHGTHYDEGVPNEQKHFITKFGLAGHYPSDIEKAPIVERYPDLRGKFHAIICGEVLEHLKVAPGQLIHDLLDLLAPNGVVLLTTPNAMSRRWVEELFNGTKMDARYDRNQKWQHEKGHTHVRCYTEKELRQAVENAGGRTLMAGAIDYYVETERHWLNARYASARGQLVFLIGHR